MGLIKVTCLLFYALIVYGQLTPEQTILLQDVCPGSGNCYQSGVPESCCLPCSCDLDVCTGMRNCCPHLNTSVSQTGSDVNSTFSPDRKSCVSMTVNLENQLKKLSSNNSSVSYARLGVVMITTCPGEINETRCNTPDLAVLNQSIPVMSKLSGIHYRNIFCAECNNESLTSLTNWKTYITCSAVSVVKSDILLFPVSADKVYQAAATTKDNFCGVEFMPPDDMQGPNELCFENTYLIDTCPEGYANQSVVKACKSLHMPYTSLENGTTQVYENYFCYLCNRVGVEDENQCFHDFQLQIHADNLLVVELNIDADNDSLILTPWIQNDLTPSKFIPSGVKCRERTVYDPYTESCRNWYCPLGRQFANVQDCVPTFVDVIKTSFTVALKFVPDEYTLSAYQPLNKTILAEQILEEVFGNDVGVEVIILAIKEDFSYMYAFIKLTIDSNTVIKSRVFNESTYGRNISLNVSDSEPISFIVDLSVGVKIELSTISFNDIIVIDLIDFTGLLNVFRVHLDDIKASYQLTSVSKLAFCTQILLHRNEVFDYIDVFDVVAADHRVHNGEFIRTAAYNDIRICLSDYLRNVQKYLDIKNKEREYTPQAILSVICNMLSIAGLLGTIFTYILFDELRSIPGKNNMMLAMHLLVAQILYQFGMDQTDMPTLCIALGVFIHLFWLTAIFWMNACTLHMFRTFVTGQSYRSVRALDPQVCCYALYCYGVATSMVAINMSISMYKSGGRDVGYGGRVCYISDPVMVGWVFALPVGVIIILNMGFFFAVVYQISASTMRRRGKSTDRANTIIYMKLSSLTGVTWIFGYLYLWTDFTPLEYIFIVLNAGQGVFIFISFICTQRITKLYWNLIRKGCRSLRAKSCCNCFCFKKMGDTDTNVVEMNTAKVSLTAGSTSTKGQTSRKGVTTKNQLNTVSKSLNNSGSNGNSNLSDIYNDSAKIAQQLCNPTPPINPSVNHKIDNVAVNMSEAEKTIIKGVPNLAISAIGIRDIEFLPTSNQTPK